MATRKAKKLTLEKRVDQLKTKIKDFHDEALHVSDDLVDNSLSTGAKWQKLMAKTLHGGTDILGRQQDMLLSTLEEMKGQYVYGAKRLTKLVGLKKPKTKKAKKTQRTRSAKTDKAKSRTRANTASAKSDHVKDDLTLIDGIGPKFELLLNKEGINTFNQLASSGVSELKEILQKAGPIFKSHDPTKWIEQAKLVMEEKLTN